MIHDVLPKLSVLIPGVTLGGKEGKRRKARGLVLDGGKAGPGEEVKEIRKLQEGRERRCGRGKERRKEVAGNGAGSGETGGRKRGKEHGQGRREYNGEICHGRRRSMEQGIAENTHGDKYSKERYEGGEREMKKEMEKRNDRWEEDRRPREEEMGKQRERWRIEKKRVGGENDGHGMEDGEEREGEEEK
ncbi:hypothetical protein KM043_015917 [Ampulex compressa]|nr:hypothetical protein KM043_015917 [Ampulex compressa]